jgi:enoyl reductase-like protein
MTTEEVNEGLVIPLSRVLQPVAVLGLIDGVAARYWEADMLWTCTITFTSGRFVTATRVDPVAIIHAVMPEVMEELREYHRQLSIEAITRLQQQLSERTENG